MSFIRTLLKLDKSVLQRDVASFLVFKELLLDEQKVRIAAPKSRAEEKIDAAAQAEAKKQIIQELVQTGWKTKVCHTLLFQLNQAEQFPFPWEDVITFEDPLVEEALQFRQLFLDCYAAACVQLESAEAEPFQDVIDLLINKMKLTAVELDLLKTNVEALLGLYQGKGLFCYTLTFIEVAVRANLEKEPQQQEQKLVDAIAKNIPIEEARKRKEKKIEEAEKKADLQKERILRGSASTMTMGELKERERNAKNQIFNMYVTLGRNKFEIEALQNFCAECNTYQAALEKYLQTEAKEIHAKYFGGEFARNSDELFRKLVADLNEEKSFSSMPHIRLVLVNYQNVLMLHRHALACHKPAKDRLTILIGLLSEETDALELENVIFSVDHEVDKSKGEFAKKAVHLLSPFAEKPATPSAKSNPLDKLRELASVGAQKIRSVRTLSAANATEAPQARTERSITSPDQVSVPRNFMLLGSPVLSSVGAALRMFKRTSSRSPFSCIVPVNTPPVTPKSISVFPSQHAISDSPRTPSGESLSLPVVDVSDDMVELKIDVGAAAEVKLSIVAGMRKSN